MISSLLFSLFLACSFASASPLEDKDSFNDNVAKDADKDGYWATTYTGSWTYWYSTTTVEITSSYTTESVYVTSDEAVFSWPDDDTTSLSSISTTSTMAPSSSATTSSTLMTSTSSTSSSVSSKSSSAPSTSSSFLTSSSISSTSSSTSFLPILAPFSSVPPSPSTTSSLLTPSTSGISSSTSESSTLITSVSVPKTSSTASSTPISSTTPTSSFVPLLTSTKMSSTLSSSNACLGSAIASEIVRTDTTVLTTYGSTFTLSAPTTLTLTAMPSGCPVSNSTSYTSSSSVYSGSTSSQTPGELHPSYSISGSSSAPASQVVASVENVTLSVSPSTVEVPTTETVTTFHVLTQTLSCSTPTDLTLDSTIIHVSTPTVVTATESIWSTLSCATCVSATSSSQLLSVEASSFTPLPALASSSSGYAPVLSNDSTKLRMPLILVLAALFLII